MARVQARIYRCAAALDDSDYDAFMDWIEGLTDGQAAAVYRKLAA